MDEGEIARNQIYSHSAGAMLPVNADMCHLRRNNPPFPRLSATEADSPSFHPATAYALIGAAHAHNKRVHAKERTRLSDPSYKTRHPLDPSSRIHGELVESTRERGRGWRREFYTILALPHARSPSTPRHGPLLVNELSKHRVFVVGRF